MRRQHRHDPRHDWACGPTNPAIRVWWDRLTLTGKKPRNVAGMFDQLRGRT